MGTLMKSLLLLPLLLISVVLTAGAAPRLEVVGGLKQDIGTFGPGTYHGKVSITNVGDSALQILDIKSSCGCLYGSTSCKTLAPGDTCAIEWHMMESSGMRGPHTKTVTLYTNDPTNPNTVISFHWTTVADLESESGGTYITLRYDTLRGLWRGEAKLVNVGKDTLSISPPSASRVMGMEVVELLPRKPLRLLPNASFPLSLVVRRERNSGDTTTFKGGYAVLEVKTSGQNTPLLSLIVTGYP